MAGAGSVVVVEVVASAALATETAASAQVSAAATSGVRLVFISCKKTKCWWLLSMMAPDPARISNADD
jgi:hypothetical protein